jgi:hypothetical protein
MLGYLFDPEGVGSDPYRRGSSHVDGAWSILTGIAANESIRSGRTVDVPAFLADAGIELDPPASAS